MRTDRRGPRPPRRITSAYLRAVTGRYLERYATSSRHLERLLMQRVHRSVAHHGDDLEEKAALVREEIERLVRLRLLDDRQYATDKAHALHRRGAGTRKIRAALRAKGLGAEEIEAAVAELSEGEGDPDWHAALTYARKRRIGPWRRQPLDDERRRKELGRLGRAGFSWEVARRIVELDEPVDG